MSRAAHDDPRIDAAIQETWITHPYYSAAIGRLRIVADRAVPTMATSKYWVTHYNPDTLDEWTVQETAAVLVHELEHLLRDHDGRCRDRDPKGWNIAADAEINQRLAGLPSNAVYPETLGMPRGMTAEVYYGASGQGGKSGASGKGSGDGAGQCGSSAGGPVQPHEAGDAARPGPGAVDRGKAARQEAASQIMYGAGTADAADLRDWAERELGIDRASWYSALASAVGHVMAPYGAPTRWKWPGRRDMRDVGGAMLPRWTGERPSCAVVIDTSSSISPMDLDMAKAAGHYIGRMADVVYYGCNTYPTRYGATLPDRIRGGGGTDMRAGIEIAIAEGARAVVVITDCETPWPQEPGRVPVIIGANPSSRWHVRTVPDWMTVLPIMADES